MKWNTRGTFMLLACGIVVLIQSPTVAVGSGIAGVIGFDPVEHQSCIAVRMMLDDDEALSGVRWYNNDGTVTFAEVYLTSGQEGSPGLLSDAVVAAELVQGGSSAWSQVLFEEDYVCDTGWIYVIYRLPYGSVQVAEGEGGGAGIGYMTNGTGVAGWLTLEGTEWDPLHPSLGFAVEAVVSDRDEGSVLLAQSNKSQGGADGNGEPSTGEVRTTMLSPQPNPFNPQTCLKFVLKDSRRVDLCIYDLQGRLVRQLASKVYSAGEHTLTWYGRNDQGRDVASGVYLVRLLARDYSQTHRLVLVR